MTGLTALVLAGSRPRADPLATAHGIDLKPLIPVAGVHMVRRPVEALLAMPQVGRVRVLTQAPERIAGVLPADPRLTVERSGASIAGTIEAICLDPATEWPLLVTTADHALLDGAMVDEFVGRGHGADLAIGVVERQRLLARFPDATRTWLRFRGGAYSGANLFLLGSRNVVAAIELWRGVEQDRKTGRRLLAALGPAVLLGAAFRLMTVDQIAGRLGRRLGLAIRVVKLSDPLAAVDVDKESDLRLVEAILSGRA